MCDCIQEVNKALAPHNTEIAIAFCVTNDGEMVPKVPVTTTKINRDKRGSPMRAFAAFCPFCGEKL